MNKGTDRKENNKKWIVRWVVNGFVVKENFEKKQNANKYYNKIINDMSEHLEEIQMYCAQ